MTTTLTAARIAFSSCLAAGGVAVDCFRAYLHFAILIVIITIIIAARIIADAILCHYNWLY